MIVVDTNILSYFYLREQHALEAEALLERYPEWVAPALWRSEFRNLLTGYVRRNRITLENAVNLMQEAENLLREREYRPDSRAVLALAHASGCTAYDCEFVALAKELGVPLVTHDRQILKAFPEVAVPLAVSC